MLEMLPEEEEDDMLRLWVRLEFLLSVVVVLRKSER